MEATFYPSLDGRTNTNARTSWSLTRNQNSDSVSKTETTQPESLNAIKNSDTDYRLGRTWLVFDTSTIPYTAEISSATLRVTINYIDGSSLNIAITESYLQDTSNLVVSDHPRCYDTLLSDYQATGTTDNVDKTLTLNAAGLTKIVKGGVTQFALRNQNDISNSAPSSSNRTGIHFVENTTQGYRPLLTIEYTLPSSSGFFALLGGL